MTTEQRQELADYIERVALMMGPPARCVWIAHMRAVFQMEAMSRGECERRLAERGGVPDQAGEGRERGSL